MIDYSINKPLYLQIADHVCEQILQGVWTPEERIASARELGVTLGVNMHTVAKSFDYLQDKQILFQRRGIGYFVEKDGIKRIREMYKTEFFKTDLPYLFKKMQKLNVSVREIVLEYERCCGS